MKLFVVLFVCLFLTGVKSAQSQNLFDDFEDGDTVNVLGGTWQVTGGAGGTLAFEVTFDGYNSDYSLHVTGNYANWPGVEGTLSLDGSPVDVSKYKGIRFAVKASIVDTLMIRVREQKRITDGTYEFAKYNFVPTSDWSIVEIPFEELVSSYTSGPLNPPFDATDILAIDFASFKKNIDGNFSIDQIEFYSDAEVFDDFEDGDAVNSMGGAWQITGGAGGTLAFEVADEGYNSDYSLHVTGNYTSWPGAEATFSFDGSPADISQYKGIRFAVKAAIVDTLMIRVREQKRITDGTYEFAKYNFVPTSDWSVVEIPFSDLVSSYTSGPLNPSFDATDILAIDFAPFKKSIDGDFYIDQIEFVTNITTSVEKDISSLPAEYVLSQNYPNPFNPSTTIEFKLAQAGFAVLKVYNILGKEIALLVNEELPAGTFITHFEASGLSSGIYFCTLRVNNKTFSNKMIMMK